MWPGRVRTSTWTTSLPTPASRSTPARASYCQTSLYLTSLNVNGFASLSPSGDKLLVTRGVGVTGRLDLADNDMIVRSTAPGSWDGTGYGGVTGLIQTGFNTGTWDGNGIVTTRPDAVSGLTTLATANAEQALGIGPADTTLWNGHLVTGSDVLVKYTYGGDANLDGAVTGDDYSVIDFNIAVPNALGYYNGDFNYDGIISGDDYSVIDFNIAAQGAPL